MNRAEQLALPLDTESRGLIALRHWAESATDSRELDHRRAVVEREARVRQQRLRRPA